MGRPPKEFDDDTITAIINEKTDHADNDTRLPSTTEIVNAYEVQAGQNVNQKTFLHYLDRSEKYRKVKVRDYFGWRVDQ